MIYSKLLFGFLLLLLLTAVTIEATDGGLGLYHRVRPSPNSKEALRAKMVCAPLYLSFVRKPRMRLIPTGLVPLTRRAGTRLFCRSHVRQSPFILPPLSPCAETYANADHSQRRLCCGASVSNATQRYPACTEYATWTIVRRVLAAGPGHRLVSCIGLNTHRTHTHPPARRRSDIHGSVVAFGV